MGIIAYLLGAGTGGQVFERQTVKKAQNLTEAPEVQERAAAVGSGEIVIQAVQAFRQRIQSFVALFQTACGVQRRK